MKKSLKKHLPVYLRRTVAFITLEIFLISQGPMAFAGDMGEPNAPKSTGKIKEIILDHYQEKVSEQEAAVIRYKEVTLEIPAGAVKNPVAITIEELGYINRLNPGMRNVTGSIAGYRFKPDGMVFEKNIRVTIPYDKEKITSESELHNLYTYFYNTQAGYWERLERIHLDRENGWVTSLTNHFTDIINSTITLPDSPEPLSFNPTSIKDIKAADPGTGINLIEPPQANNQGNAALSYPIETPPGRGGMQAQVEVQYNSDGGNGWMGLGWNIPIQSVSIDTRWGVPRYSPSEETETYMLDGQQLTPVVHRGALQPRSEEKIFHTRIEKDFKKIIRHGNHPANYWWEATDKNGSRYFYGGTPEAGLVSDSVLSLSQGSNIFKWTLVQVRNTNGNTIDYTYVKVFDSGLDNGTGGVQGLELYLKEIRYTGSAADPGLYSVNFIRDRELEEDRRPDISIDARAGFKVVTTDLLRRVEVKLHNDLIRSYEFNYQEGAFRKMLLNSLIQYGEDGEEFNRHEFTYYNEISNGDNYQGFASPVNWNTGYDGISAGLLGHGSATALGSSISGSTGGHLYVGVNLSKKKKAGSAGFKAGFSNSDSRGVVALADLNGDGLQDKVFKNGGFFYRPNQSGPDGVTVFGAPVPLPTLPAISKDSSETTSFGVETYLDVNFMANTSRTFTTASVYFSDVNGDGLTDLVNDGVVLFNRLVEGVPTFATDSSGTPAPVSSGNVDTEGLVGDYTAIYEERIDACPLMDAVRCWEAPFDGQIAITAPVNLVKLGREGYHTADGVRVAIQHNGGEIWSETIDENDYTSYTPVGVDSIAVQQGDRIYFRVQSVFDGAFDQVEWDPEITYLNVPSGLRDVNDLDPYCYKSSEDFVYAGRGGEVEIPISGTVHVTGDVLKNGITTDNITMVIYRNGSPVISRALAWNETGDITLDDEINVTQLDKLKFRIVVDSPIDLSQLEWNPEVYYTAADDPDIPITDPNGEPTIHLKVLYDIDMYPTNELDEPQEWWEASEDGIITVIPRLIVNFPFQPPPADLNGTVVFTLKKSNSLIGKIVISIVEGVVQPFSPLELEVTEGECFYFDFSSRDPNLVNRILGTSVGVRYDYFTEDDPSIPVPSVFHSAEIPNLHPQSFRGWSVFAYNGNRQRAFQPIHESELVIDEDYDSENPKAFLMIPYPDEDFWRSEDELCWVAAEQISSSRKGSDYISVPMSGEFGGSRGVNRFSYASQSTSSGGFLFGSWSDSEGTSYGEVEFMDMNGDRFPDILGNGRIQYTEMTGGLEESNRTVNGFSGKIRSNANDSYNVGIGGNPASIIPNASGNPIGSTKGDMKTLMPTLGVTLNFLGDGTSTANYDLMDMNGDGLPDRVIKDGAEIRVALNLGYGFAQAETWGNGEINRGKNENAPIGVSLGFNTGDYGFGGGLSLSKSSSRVEKSFTDINGDGLIDMVSKNGPTLNVSLNTGSGFTQQVVWQGALENKHITDTANTNLGGGLYFTIPIPIPIPIPFPPFVKTIYIIINPGGDASEAMGRQEAALRDVNGDGYTDHVSSDNDGSMIVALSQVGRTNKLETVNRPLGASFELSYERDGNTYDLPQSKWVLNKVIVQDGHAGDGVDSQVTTFTYSSGMHNRFEREFYGYSTVTTEQRDPSGGDALYRTITRNYHNDSFYTKGLLESEITRDADANKFNETVNQYYLFDVHTQSSFIDTYPNNTIATVFPQLIRTDKLFYEGQSSPGMWTYSTFEYDEYGNVTRFYDAGQSGAGDDVEAQIEYHLDLANYIVGKPSLIEVYGNGLLLKHREASYEPGTGNLIELRQYLADGQAAVTNLEYFVNGNLKSVTGPSNLSGERYIIEYQYDPVVSTHIALITDSYGYTSSAEYNLFYGLEKSSVDLNDNLMRREYDHFGRLERVFAPYDEDIPAVEFAYYPDELPARAVTKNKIHFESDNSETLDTVLFIDGLKRVIQTKKEGEVLEEGNTIPSYGMNVTGKVLFDLMGRVWQQGQPVFERGYTTSFFAGIPLKNPTVNQYDILGRTTRVTLPDASEIVTEYSIEDDRFETRVVDPEGKVKISYADVRGNTVKIEQFNQGETITTVYEYNSLNEITAVIDTLGNTTSMTYDILGRRTGMHNPDSGLVESFYDLSGNLISKIDGNLRTRNEEINYIYEYNRLVRIDYPESSDVEYFYGQTGADFNRAGRLSQVIDESGATEFFYGKLGEEVKNIKTMNFLVPGHEPWSFTSETGFDYLGRVEWTEYPDGERLVYEYDRGGQIKKAYGEKQGDLYDYVKEIHYDEYGQRVYIRYGNDVETRYSYDPYRRWLETIDTGNSEGITFQDVAYSFDRVGNVLSINNMARDVSQSFQYDDLYQLIGAEGESPDKNKISQYTQSFNYDSIGNIIRKTSSNLLTPGNSRPKELNYEFTYTYGGNRPHAATQIGGWAYQYDENGNTIGKERIEPGDGGGVSGQYLWNEENRLTEAKVNGKSTYFLYNASGERTVKRGENGETLYVNKFYQLQNRQEVTKHFFVGETRIVSKLSHFHNPDGLYDSGFERNNLYTYHPDHIGSTTYVTDPYGDEFEHLEYTPYGETWVDEGTNKNIIGYRFTSKELDTETGLYYFGARYLDPRTSRWISPDPALESYVPVAPVDDEAKKHNQNLPGQGGVFNPVNLALYHYAGNNPVKYVDPTGLQTVVVEGGGLLLMAVVVGSLLLREAAPKTEVDTGAIESTIKKRVAQIKLGLKVLSILANPYKHLSEAADEGKEGKKADVPDESLEDDPGPYGESPVSESYHPDPNQTEVDVFKDSIDKEKFIKEIEGDTQKLIDELFKD